MEDKQPVNLPRIMVEPKSGSEPLHSDGRALGPTLRDFWRWSVSDLVSNATRGRLAEFIVANALAIPTSGVRDEWSAFDLQTAEGVKVEVKSAAYVQSWFQSKLSEISFRTPKTRAFDPDTGEVAPEPRRQAHVYVFAVLKHKDQPTIDPLNIDQWEFYVVSTVELDARIRSQYGIALSTLKTLCRPLSYGELRTGVLQAAKSVRRRPLVVPVNRGPKQGLGASNLPVLVQPDCDPGRASGFWLQLFPKVPLNCSGHASCA